MNPQHAPINFESHSRLKHWVYKKTRFYISVCGAPGLLLLGAG